MLLGVLIVVRVRVIDGYKRILDIRKEFKSEFKEYNVLIKNLGLYLKPSHIVVVKGKKYVYHSRYWWRLERGKEKRKIKWKYLGKSIPKNIPKPPPYPLEGLAYLKDGNDVIIDMNTYMKFKHLFHGLKVKIE